MLEQKWLSCAAQAFNQCTGRLYLLGTKRHTITRGLDPRRRQPQGALLENTKGGDPEVVLAREAGLMKRLLTSTFPSHAGLTQRF